METRVAVLSIIVENEDAVSELNELLHRFGKFIIGRMGLPYRQKFRKVYHRPDGPPLPAEKRKHHLHRHRRAQ